ncbi:hypothetical protein pb186bvf_003738 [Paramecium bursaria]
MYNLQKPKSSIFWWIYEQSQMQTFSLTKLRSNLKQIKQQ